MSAATRPSHIVHDRPSRPLLAIVTLFAASALASSAAAQPSTSQSAAAQALFEQGRTLMAQGRYADACPKLEESQRLDPGSGTLLNLARCYERAGRLASAWIRYLEAASAAEGTGNKPRVREARERAEALRPRIPQLVIGVAPAATTIPGLVVLRDGENVGPAQWGSAIPVDAGRYTVQARAPGRVTWEQTVEVQGEATSTSLTVPELAAEPSRTPAVAPPPAAPARSPETALGTQRIMALTLGGVGVVALGIGTVFGLKSKAHHDEAEKYCDGAECTDARGVRAGEDAYSAGTVSTVAMVASVVSLGAGAALWLTAPDGKGVQVGVTPGHLQIRGAF